MSSYRRLRIDHEPIRCHQLDDVSQESWEWQDLPINASWLIAIRLFGNAPVSQRVCQGVRLAQACQWFKMHDYRLGRGGARCFDTVERQGTMGRIRQPGCAELAEMARGVARRKQSMLTFLTPSRGPSWRSRPSRRLSPPRRLLRGPLLRCVGRGH